MIAEPLSLALGAASALLAYPLWTVIHEASHLAAARALGPLRDVELWLYPHRDERGNFFFARVKWRWDPPLRPSPLQVAAVVLAPRLADLLGAVGFVLCAAFVPAPWLLAALALTGGALVDLFVGSLGVGELTDLRRASTVLDLSPWLLRGVGMGVLLASLALGLALALT